jgi:hypothetical protein
MAEASGRAVGESSPPQQVAKSFEAKLDSPMAALRRHWITAGRPAGRSDRRWALSAQVAVHVATLLWCSRTGWDEEMAGEVLMLLPWITSVAGSETLQQDAGTS